MLVHAKSWMRACMRSGLRTICNMMLRHASRWNRTITYVYMQTYIFSNLDSVHARMYCNRFVHLCRKYVHTHRSHALSYTHMHARLSGLYTFISLVSRQCCSASKHRALIRQNPWHATQRIPCWSVAISSPQQSQFSTLFPTHSSVCLSACVPVHYMCARGAHVWCASYLFQMRAQARIHTHMKIEKHVLIHIQAYTHSSVVRDHFKSIIFSPVCTS